jgi:mono/diheme cytochrome c family protein
MRAKTLGIFLLIGFALFTALWWLTDEARRDATFNRQQEELLEYGHELFGPPTPEIAVTANCANCHGPDGTGGEVGDTGVRAPNLHSRSIYEKLQVNPDYVNLVIRFGGVVVSGRVDSPMPAWSTEVAGPLTIQQVDALTALVESWAAEAGEAPVEEVPDTPEAGQQVYNDAGCGGCHGADLAGQEGVFPSLLNIGNEPVTDLPTPISQVDQLVADYEENPRNMLELWIRDSAENYNDGAPTGMPPHPEDSLSESAMQALITFLLEQKQ